MTQHLRSECLESSLHAVLSLAVAAFVIVGCQDSTMVASSTEKKPSGAEGSALTKSAAMGPARVLRARLEPLGSSGVTGEVTVRVKGDNLAVVVNAKGLKADVEHAQHFHRNATCSPPGSPFVALDSDIANAPTDATNADPGDDRFPTASPGGSVNYQESASRSALASALGTSPDLANRTVVVHKAGTPIGPAAACGELNPTGN